MAGRVGGICILHLRQLTKRCCRNHSLRSLSAKRGVIRMDKFFIPTLCLALSVLCTGVIILLEPSMREETIFDKIRLILPGILFVSLIGWHTFKSKFKVWVTVLIFLSIPFFVLVANWLSIFTITDYREHRRPEIFLLSSAYLTFYFSMMNIGGKKIV